MTFTASPLFPGDLFDSAARLAEACAGRLTAVTDTDARIPALGEIWQEVAALGWPAVIVPETRNGAGGGLDDLVAIIDGAGRNALPLPLAACCGVAPVLLAHLAASQIQSTIAAGTMCIAPTFTALQRDPHSPAASAVLHDGALHLAGKLTGVEAPPAVTHLLVLCQVANAPGLILLPADATGLGLHHFERLDSRPSLDLLLDGVTLPAAALLAHGPTAARAGDAALALGSLLVCVEAVSAMGALVEKTVAYLSTRVQFGETLSRFQVLRHGAVDLYTRYEVARAMVQNLLASDTPAVFGNRALHLAKLHLGAVGRTMAQDAIQLHGGMGLTDELPAARLIKRLLTIEFDFGDQAFHTAALTA